MGCIMNKDVDRNCFFSYDLTVFNLCFADDVLINYGAHYETCTCLVSRFYFPSSYLF